VKEMMDFEVRLFGNLRDLASSDTAIIEQCSDIHELKKKLDSKYPQFRNASFAVAVNHQVVRDDHKINPGDEIALLPPFSGG
jgi:molybdopterin synthase sulfur carrier subunit